MQDGKTIVFVEVRYRSRSDFGSAAESIDSRKQQRLVVTAQHYLQTQPLLAGCDCRFDVVLIRGDARQPSVEWIRNAFQA